MDETTRARLRELTAQARAAYSNVPDDELVEDVAAAYAEVRQEMTEELSQTREARRRKAADVGARRRTPQTA